MSSTDHQKLVANYMGAVAHLLSGRPGRHAEFIQRVEIILSGNEPHALQLMQFTGRVRASRRPVIWMHHSADAPNVPQIGLVAADGDKVRVFENCMLWMSSKDGRASLIPDSFKFGAFRFDDDLVLRRARKAPSANFKAAQPAMIRAYDRLLEIEAEQATRGDVFELPQLAKAA